MDFKDEFIKGVSNFIDEIKKITEENKDNLENIKKDWETFYSGKNSQIKNLPTAYDELINSIIFDKKNNVKNNTNLEKLELLVLISKKSYTINKGVDYYNIANWVSFVIKKPIEELKSEIKSIEIPTSNSVEESKNTQKQETEGAEQKQERGAANLDQKQFNEYLNEFFYSDNKNSFFNRFINLMKSSDEKENKNDEVEKLKNNIVNIVNEVEGLLSINKVTLTEKNQIVNKWNNIPNKDLLDPIIYQIIINAFDENIDNDIIKGRYYRYLLVFQKFLEKNNLHEAIIEIKAVYELGESLKIEEFKDLSLSLNKKLDYISKSIGEENLQKKINSLYTLYAEINKKDFAFELEKAYDEVIVSETGKMETIVKMFKKTLDDKIESINESLQIKVKSFDDLHKEYADDLKRTLKKELQEVNKDVRVKISTDDKITIKDLNEKFEKGLELKESDVELLQKTQKQITEFLNKGFQITEQDKSYIDSAKKAFKNYQKTMLLAVILPITVALASILTGAYVLQTAYSNKGNSLGEDQIIVNKTRAEALENEKTLFKLFLNSKEKDYNKFKEKFLQENQGNFPHFKDLNSEEVIEK